MMAKHGRSIEREIREAEEEAAQDAREHVFSSDEGESLSCDAACESGALPCLSRDCAHRTPIVICGICDAPCDAGARLCNDCRRRGASFVGIGMCAS